MPSRRASSRRIGSSRLPAFYAPSIDFIPDLSFENYERLVDRTPDLVVVPYLLAWKREDAAVIPWIRAHVGPHTVLMSICAGAEIVAATGMFDGHRRRRMTGNSTS